MESKNRGCFTKGGKVTLAEIAVALYKFLGDTRPRCTYMNLHIFPAARHASRVKRGYGNARPSSRHDGTDRDAVNSATRLSRPENAEDGAGKKILSPPTAVGVSPPRTSSPVKHRLYHRRTCHHRRLAIDRVNVLGKSYERDDTPLFSLACGSILPR